MSHFLFYFSFIFIVFFNYILFKELGVLFFLFGYVLQYSFFNKKMDKKLNSKRYRFSTIKMMRQLQFYFHRRVGEYPYNFILSFFVPFLLFSIFLKLFAIDFLPWGILFGSQFYFIGVTFLDVPSGGLFVSK